MKSTKTLHPPRHLKAAGKAYWTLIHESFDVAPHQAPLVVVCAEALDRATRCRTIIDREGEVQVDRFGQSKPHPLLRAERDSRQLFLAGAKQLGIDAQTSSETPKVEW